MYFLLNFDPMNYDLQLPQKGFWKTIELKFIHDPVWLDEYVLVALAFQSPYNL